MIVDPPGCESEPGNTRDAMMMLRSDVSGRAGEQNAYSDSPACMRNALSASGESDCANPAPGDIARKTGRPEDATSPHLSLLYLYIYISIYILKLLPFLYSFLLHSYLFCSVCGLSFSNTLDLVTRHSCHWHLLILRNIIQEPSIGLEELLPHKNLQDYSPKNTSPIFLSSHFSTQYLNFLFCNKDSFC